MELNDRLLALRWWKNKTNEKRIELAKEAKFRIENRDFKSLTGNEIEWIWRNQPYNNVKRLDKTNNILVVVQSIYDEHKIKLNKLKENRSKADKENWSEVDINSVDEQIRLLASILSDLNVNILQRHK